MVPEVGTPSRKFSSTVEPLNAFTVGEKLSVPALLLRFSATCPRSKEISPPNLKIWLPRV